MFWGNVINWNLWCHFPSIQSTVYLQAHSAKEAIQYNYSFLISSKSCAMAFPNSLVFNIAFSVSSIPSNYIRPASNRLNLDGVYLDDCIPQIDLRCLNGSNRSDVVKQTGQACQDYGFFQVFHKHHIQDSYPLESNILVHFWPVWRLKTMAIQKRWWTICYACQGNFSICLSERLKNYSDDPMKATRISASFNLKSE